MKSFDEFWDKVAIGLNADENEESLFRNRRTIHDNPGG